MSKLDSVLAELVKKAQAGDQYSLETLAEMLRERVYPYIRRVVLDSDKSEDLVQDISMTVFQSLGQLREADRFWPWVFRIATNKVRESFRRQSSRKVIHMSALPEAGLAAMPATVEDAGSGIWRRELAKLTEQAMGQISERQRMVLSLRCYEGMAHSEIANVLGCTEINARVTFLQAKRSLLTRLRRLGVNKTALVSALAAYGYLTLPTQVSAATMTVHTAALKEGVITGLLSAKAKAACFALAAILVATSLYGMWPTYNSPIPGSGVTGLHFVHQSIFTNSANIDFQHTRSQGAFEQWYQFPEGVGGPFLFRMQRWTPTQDAKLCWWVENGDANYYVNSGTQRVTITNAHLTRSNYATRVLPTDSQEFCEFVREVEGAPSDAMIDQRGLEYERDPATGFVARRVDRRFASLGPWETVYDYAAPQAGLFDAPVNSSVKDERDAMHKRGWTYFRITGRLLGKGVVGYGQIPFTYNASKTHPPWMELMIDGQLAAVDDGRQSGIIRADGGETIIYSGGALFKGSARPWTGFHTLDVIRRDAAAERIWYSFAVTEPDKTVKVFTRAKRDETIYSSAYTIDMEHDVVEQVQYWVDKPEQSNQCIGFLKFSYLDELDEVTDFVSRPGTPPSAETTPEHQSSILWPFDLAEAIQAASESLKG